MKGILINKLHQYIRENNPGLLLQLEQDGKVSEYLSNKVNTSDALINEYKDQPAYIIEDACMDELTKDLRPSKYNYINQILQEEFEDTYQQLQQSGTLKFEVINLISQCQPVFEAIGFTEENEDSSELRNAITGTVSEYLESNK